MLLVVGSVEYEVLRYLVELFNMVFQRFDKTIRRRFLAQSDRGEKSRFVNLKVYDDKLTS